MTGDLIENFKVINGIFNYGRYFLIFLLDLKIYCPNKFLKTKSLNQLEFFSYRFFSYRFLEQIA